MSLATAKYAIADATSLPRSSTVPYARSMQDTAEDTALMLRYKDGDVAAFELLYRRHSDALYRYLLRLCMQRDAAEDVFQDAWSKIIKARHNYRPTAQFRTFLFRVAHNCFIDHLRRNKKHAVGSVADPDESKNPADPPEISAEKALARRKLDDALRRLPAEQRDAFLLHEEAGLSLDDIAHVTGVKRETAKSRLRYASNKLKLALTEALPKATGTE